MTLNVIQGRWKWRYVVTAV